MVERQQKEEGKDELTGCGFNDDVAWRGKNHVLRVIEDRLPRFSNWRFCELLLESDVANQLKKRCLETRKVTASLV